MPKGPYLPNFDCLLHDVYLTCFHQLILGHLDKFELNGEAVSEQESTSHLGHLHQDLRSDH